MIRHKIVKKFRGLNKKVSNIIKKDEKIDDKISNMKNQFRYL